MVSPDKEFIFKIMFIFPEQPTQTQHYHDRLGHTNDLVGAETSLEFPESKLAWVLQRRLYISDLPATESLKFGYADDWTLATQSKTFSHLESSLSRDIGHLNEYFDYWKLRLNAKKTLATCFHLDNKQAARKLKVTLAGQVLVHDFAPK